ncbi:hypothetical protein NBRC116493_12330 [Aurantivibrio infirmus]
MKTVKFFLWFTLLTSPAICFAASETTFPKDWRTWTSISTPLTQIGGLPGCDADVSSLPPIYQETVETYCNVRPEGPGEALVLVKPAEVENFKSKNGKMKDGPAMVLHFTELKILFVTGHKKGEPTYGVFTEDGSDITAKNPSAALGTATCRTCHTGYKAFCASGQCATATK